MARTVGRSRPPLALSESYGYPAFQALFFVLLSVACLGVSVVARPDAPAPRRSGRKKSVEPVSRGVAAAELAAGARPAEVEALQRSIAADGGVVLSAYRDPLGGHWQILAGLPVELVEPTPFQRDLSEAHVERLADVIDRMDRFIDPITAVRTPEGKYWTPNGHHRLAAVRRLRGRSVVALVLPGHGRHLHRPRRAPGRPAPRGSAHRKRSRQRPDPPGEGR